MKSLLIPLTYFCLQTCLGTTQVKRLVLDKAANAFDDQYIGCDNKMDKKASELLEEEKSKNNLLREVWDNATAHWQKVKTDLKDEYGIAIVAYTDYRKYKDIFFSTAFNQAVRGNGTSQANYMANFHFKAFHYYLTKALQDLRGNCDQMYKQTVYRGVPDVYNYEGSDPIRFGQFASSSLDKQVAEKFAKKESSDKYTIFTIHTCFGVDISKFSYKPDQKEVLIPDHEEFNVTQEAEGRFVLRSTNRTCSYFNCAYLNREKNHRCFPNSATRGGITFPGGMSPSLFGGFIILIHVAALKLTAGF